MTICGVGLKGPNPFAPTIDLSVDRPPTGYGTSGPLRQYPRAYPRRPIARLHLDGLETGIWPLSPKSSALPNTGPVRGQGQRRDDRDLPHVGSAADEPAAN